MAAERKILEDLLERILSADTGDTVQGLEGNGYVVHRARNGCRFIQLGGDAVLMEQNKTKDSRFARMARQGRKIGWVIPKQGRWQLIMLKSDKPEDADDFTY